MNLSDQDDLRRLSQSELYDDHFEMLHQLGGFAIERPLGNTNGSAN
jgi:hypothetical protein